VGCRETNTFYVFALAACVAEALLGDFNAQLSAGSCAGVSGCPWVSPLESSPLSGLQNRER